MSKFIILISKVLFYALFSLAFLPCHPAFAGCANPSETGGVSPEGAIVYNATYKTMQFCDGTTWWGMKGGGSGSLPSCNQGEALIMGASGWECCAVGDGGGSAWVQRDSQRNWYAVASSSDMTKLVAVVNGGQVYTSTDSGATWTARNTGRQWVDVASSSDGTKLVAVVAGGQIFTSTDSGVNWTPRNSARAWEAVASSADGTKLVAVVNSGGTGYIYTSTDSGVNWTQRATNIGWKDVTSSSGGTVLYAVTASGGGTNLYKSTDSGVNWTDVSGGYTYSYSVSTSADGTKVLSPSAYWPNALAYSINSWSTNNPVYPMYGNVSPEKALLSADGLRMFTITDTPNYGVYMSFNGGSTWMDGDLPVVPASALIDIATSSDGTKLVVLDYGGYIYTKDLSTTGGCPF